MTVALWVAVAFVAGSLPPAVPIGRLWGVDVRHEGTQNPGVSNVRHLAGMFPAVLTFLADLAVGALVVLVPRWAGASLEIQAATAVAAVAGRAWSPWLHGRGGRSQMLILTSTLILVPWVGVVFLVVYALGVATKRLALTGLLNLLALPVLCGVVYGEAWAVGYGIGVAVVGVFRRIQGSPDGDDHSLAQRILFDRERAPNDEVPAS